MKAKQLPENKARYSKTQKEIWNTPEKKEFSRIQQKERWKNEEFSKKVIDGIHRYYDDPENKAKWLESVRSEEYRNKQREINKRRFSDENERRKLAEANYRRYADPEKYEDFKNSMKSYSKRKQEEHKILNNILHDYIKYDNSIEKYGTKRKWKLIFEICDAIHILQNKEK